MHYQPDKARFLIDGDVVNHVFDHKLAVELLRHNYARILEIYKSKARDGVQGFLHPSEILDRLGITEDDDDYQSRSYEEDSRDYIPRNCRSTKSGEYEGYDEDEQTEYKPKAHKSEDHSLPENKECSDTTSKNYFSQDRGKSNSRKLSEFDQIVESANQESFKQVCLDIENKNPQDNIKYGDEYEEIAWDIANYIKQDEGCIPRMQWEINQNDEDEDGNFAIDRVQQNMNYLNDPNEVSDEATAHYYNTSSDSLEEDNPSQMHERGRAWAFDDLDDEADYADNHSSPITFITSRLRNFKAFYDPYMEPITSKFQSVVKEASPEIAPFNSDAIVEDKMQELNEPVKEQVEYIVPDPVNMATLMPENIPTETNELVMVGPKPEAPPKVIIEIEVDTEDKTNMNMFLSRAQKKKYREAKKKQARKQKLEEVKTTTNQDGSLPSDSIDVSCIQKKFSKCDNSEEENEICNLIEDPISQQYLTAAQSAFERRLEEALENQPNPGETLKDDEAVCDDSENKDKEYGDNDDCDKKGKKKKKKKKKVEIKAPPITSKNKLSGFQQKLMQEQEVHLEKTLKKPDPKIDKPAPKPQTDKRSLDQDQFELAQQLFELSQQDSHSINNLIMLMNKLDANPNSFKFSLDSFSCEETCKVYFTPYAK